MSDFEVHPVGTGLRLERLTKLLRRLLRDDVIGAKIDDYDRSCIRAAEVYDRQDRYIRRLERQS
jgi:hypothetical protein